MVEQEDKRLERSSKSFPPPGGLETKSLPSKQRHAGEGLKHTTSDIPKLRLDMDDVTSRAPKSEALRESKSGGLTIDSTISEDSKV